MVRGTHRARRHIPLREPGVILTATPGRVSGDPKVRNLVEAEAGYHRMDQSRLVSLAREFEIDYAVFEQPFDGRQLQAEVVLPISAMWC